MYYTASGIEFLQYLPWACGYLFLYYPRPCALSNTIHIVFSALRAYALSSGTHGQWSILTLVLLSSLAPSIVNFVVAIISRVCLIASDLLVMCITWKATYKTSREMRVLGQGTSLSSILFRNGGHLFAIQTLACLDCC
ncbi:hypothetical protein C8Q74DRAFT_1203629 [Fomes fomentarius]|nr:hypothetical protein C8Q74DRAFT_1203629 [Fomes fomentarius]